MGINHVVFFKGIFLSHMPPNFTDTLSIWPYRNCVYFTVYRNDIVCIVYAVHEIITRFMLKFTVFNATFNNISVISWRSVLFLEEIGVLGKKPTDLSKVTDKLFHIMLYLVIITAKQKNQTNKKIKSNKNKTKNKTPKNNNKNPPPKKNQQNEKRGKKEKKKYM